MPSGSGSGSHPSRLQEPVCETCEEAWSRARNATLKLILTDLDGNVLDFVYCCAECMRLHCESAPLVIPR